MKGNGILGPNGRPVRQPRDAGGDLCTNAKAQAIANQVCQFYMDQVPGLVAHMLKEALEAHGLQLQPPEVVPSEPDVSTGPTVTAAPASPVEDEERGPGAVGEQAGTP